MNNKKREKEIKQLLSVIDINIEDLDDIISSLIHPSFIFEKDSKKIQHNQRLEFLGDAVVGLVIAEYLYQTYPEEKEGNLTKMRAAIVCEGALAEAAREIQLGKYIQMGKGEKLGGGENRTSNLADAWEALVGAIYFQVGLDGVRDFILRSLKKTIEDVAEGNYGDFKTKLQEIVQRMPESEIEYEIIEENGPDHDKDFLSGVFINKELVSTGRGKTKKEAEQGAAKAALKNIGDKL